MASGDPFAGDDAYRLLFEEAGDGLFFSTGDGVYLNVNRSGHRMLGYQPGELVGKHIAQCIMDRDVPRLGAALSAVRRGEAQVQIWPMLRKDGSLIELEVLAQPLSNGLVLAVVRDVDARTEFGRQLQASEAKLRSILTTAPDIIMTVDRKGRISFINRTYPPYTPEQVVGSSCFDYVPPQMRGRVEQAIEYVFTTGQIDSYELARPPDAEGRVGWSAVRAGPQIEGNQVVAVTLCASDVSEQKRSAARSNELLERMRRIGTLLPGVIYQYRLYPDGRSQFPYASERLREIFHVAPEDVHEDASVVFARVHAEDHPELIESLRDSARTLAPWRHSFRVNAPSGETRWLLGNSTPAREPDGSTLFHGFITDVTEQKHAEEARARLEAQLRQAQKMESVGQLAGGVAHDFNNLLTAIGAFAELAQDSLAVDSKAAEYLSGIRAAVTRGAVLTQQLLAFARKKIVQPQDVDLNEIVDRIAPMIRRLVGEHIRVELELASEPAAVRVDVGSLEQVIMNLVVNARDAMGEGGTLTLATANVTLDERSVTELPRGRYATLTVSDTGPGMEPEVRARLFEPFFTTKPQGSGTGLGLAMCHGIIKQAAGAIVADSAPGRGASLHVYLPSRARVANLPQPRAPRDPVRTGCETLLVVEDEPAILRLTEAALSRLGYRVVCASDGVDALERAGAEHIDLLITDVVMPRMGGRELELRLRALCPGIKVLFTSGYAENLLAIQGALPAGVQLMEKPYTFAALADRIRGLLDGR